MRLISLFHSTLWWYGSKECLGVKARQPCCSNTHESDYNNDISEKSFEFQVLLPSTMY